MLDERKKDTSEPFCVVVGGDMNVDTSVFNYIFRDFEQPATIASKRGDALCLRTPMAPINARHQSSVHPTPILPYPSKLCKRCVARTYVREGNHPVDTPYPEESDILMTVCKTRLRLVGYRGVA